MKTMLLAISLILMMVASSFAKTPCDNVNIQLVTNQDSKLCAAIAAQLNVKSVEILQVFKFSGWSIWYVDSHAADPAFLFYDSSPLIRSYVNLWSGAAMSNEERSIRNWVVNSMPNIPQDLASCFAWHVAKGRDL